MIYKQIIVLFISLTCFIETASSAITHTFEDVRYDFYDAAGNQTAADLPIIGGLDLIDGSGYFFDQTLSGNNWSADITHINEWGGTSGSGDIENHRFEWTTESWFIGGSAVWCYSSLNLDDCSDERNSGGIFLSSEVNFYEYTLTEGQFSWEVYFNASRVDITDFPLLAVLEVTNTDIDGAMTFITVDSDADGVPGSAILEGPFPGQTLALSGVLVPVAAVPLPASIWLFGSGLVALCGIRRRNSI